MARYKYEAELSPRRLFNMHPIHLLVCVLTSFVSVLRVSAQDNTFAWDTVSSIKYDCFSANALPAERDGYPRLGFLLLHIRVYQTLGNL